MNKEETIIQTEDVKVRVMNLPPGKSTAFHHHTEITDTMFGISGKVVVEMKNLDDEIILGPGDRCTVKPGRIHRVRNILSNETSRYLLIQGVGKYDFLTEK